MDATEYAEVVRRLTSALSQIGLTVERGVRQGGSIIAWEPVSTERLLARWLTMSWRIRPAPAELSVLRLVEGTTADEEEA